MFADRARIFVAGGAGGSGASSFRREAHVPRGGPDGGDGGRGGDVILTAMPGLTTLGEFRRARHFRAAAGGRGAGQRRHGRDGTDVVLAVPPGTVVRSGEAWLGELTEAGQRLIVVRGGRGGRGNARFASPTHRAPTHYEKGEPAEERWIELELKLIAEVGLIGQPNAGKSTLLAALTAARPRIGAYPFTTTEPNLGVIELDGERSAVIADVPGLIEGAHAGAGMGHEFLRHVERTRVLVGVVDGAATDPAREFEAVLGELRLHDPALGERPMVVAVTKMDLPEVREAWPGVRDALRQAGHRPLPISAHDGSGLGELRDALTDALAAADRAAAAAAPAAPLRVHRFDPGETDWSVVAERDGLRIRGRRIEQAALRTDFDNPESRDRFWRRLERLGIDQELRRRGAAAGTTIRIGPVELEWGEED